MKVWGITTFYGGIALSDDLGSRNQFGRNTRHIDIYAEPGSIRPAWGLHDDTDGDINSSSAIQDFCVASDGNIYAIGKKSATGGGIALYYKNGVHSSWTEVEVTTNNLSGNNRIYEYSDYLWFWAHSSYIGNYGPLSGSASVTTTKTLTRTTEGPMVEQKNNLYVAYDNKVAEYDGSDWTDEALDLPSDWLIKSICRWGKYIVIGAYFDSDNYDTISRLFFWDTSSVSWNFAKECPYGELQFIRNIGDRIVGVVGTNTDVMNLGSMAVFEWSGGECVVKRRHRWGDYTGAHILDIPDAAVDNKESVVYFKANMTDDYDGVYSWGQPVPGEPKVLHCERKPRGTELDHSPEIKALKWIGSKLHVSIWDSTDSDYAVVKDKESTSWDEEGIYESLIFSGDEPYRNKEIEKIVLTAKPLPANTTLTLKMKTDRGSWTTVGTFTTEGATQESFYKLSDDSNFPHFKELQLRVEMTGTGDEPPMLTGIYTLYNPINL